MSHNNVVIISAHPDDMEIGMGGTVAKLVESMAVITSVVLTNGGAEAIALVAAEWPVGHVEDLLVDGSEASIRVRVYTPPGAPGRLRQRTPPVSRAVCRRRPRA